MVISSGDKRRTWGGGDFAGLVGEGSRGGVGGGGVEKDEEVRGALS